jgi:hypothetical protein
VLLVPGLVFYYNLLLTALKYKVLNGGVFPKQNHCVCLAKHCAGIGDPLRIDAKCFADLGSGKPEGNSMAWYILYQCSGVVPRGHAIFGIVF